MKKFLLLIAIFILSSAGTAFAFKQPNLPADVALALLKEGNGRFVSLRMKHPHINKQRREKLITAQHPYAVIISCADSNIIPEIIFDQGLGDLFVVRNFGNVFNDNTLDAVNYAVNQLGVNLIVVLGHQHCSAVGEAIKNINSDSEYVAQVKGAIDKCNKANVYSFDNVAKINAVQTAKLLTEQSNDLKIKSIKTDLKIVPAYYSVDTGDVELINDFTQAD